jgi:hypothetical protein
MLGDLMSGQMAYLSKVDRKTRICMGVLKKQRASGVSLSDFFESFIDGWEGFTNESFKNVVCSTVGCLHVFLGEVD